MESVAFDANRVVIASIDSGELRPMYHAVVRTLLEDIELSASDDLVLLTLFDRQLPFDRKVWLARYWSRIKELGPKADEIPRLLWSLIMEDDAMDWFGAEMVIYWARNAGVAEQKIGLAFGVDLGLGAAAT